MEHHGPWLSLHSAEFLQESTGGAIVNQHTVSTFTGDIEIVVQPECETPRPIETTTARLHEHIEECTSVSVVSQNTAGLEIRDEHRWEEGEGRTSRIVISSQLKDKSCRASGVLGCSATDVGVVDDCCSSQRSSELALLGTGFGVEA